MKVRELQEILSRFDPEEPVLMYGALYREMERKCVVKDVVIGADMDNPHAPMLSPREGEDIKSPPPTMEIAEIVASDVIFCEACSKADGEKQIFHKAPACQM